MRQSSPIPNAFHFHSKLIQEKISDLDKAIEEHNISLDEISSDIKSTEKYLKNKAIKVPFVFNAGLSSSSTSNIYSSLQWLDYKDQGFRLLLSQKIHSLDYVECDSKPLIECKINQRIDFYSQLPKFLEAFSRYLQEAKLARDEQAIFDIDDIPF